MLCSTLADHPQRDHSLPAPADSRGSGGTPGQGERVCSSARQDSEHIDSFCETNYTPEQIPAKRAPDRPEKRVPAQAALSGEPATQASAADRLEADSADSHRDCESHLEIKSLQPKKPRPAASRATPQPVTRRTKLESPPPSPIRSEKPSTLNRSSCSNHHRKTKKKIKRNFANRTGYFCEVISF